MAALPRIGVVVDASQAEKLLEDIITAADNLVPVFRRRIAPDLQGHLRRQYESRGQHLSAPWPALSVTTIRLRTRVVGSKNRRRTTSRAGRAKAGFAFPMWDTGRSRRSLVNLSDPEGIRSYKPTEMVWGSRLAYLAPHHQPGGFQTRLFGKGPLKQVPQREVVPQEWPQPVAATWAGWMLDYVTGKG